jgi:hypothetical protein
MNAENDIKKILTDDEEVLGVARQSRLAPGGSMTTPNAIYATNKRIIYRDPSLLGFKTRYNDVNYGDIGDVRMEKGLFTTQIVLKSKILSDSILIPAVDKGCRANQPNNKKGNPRRIAKPNCKCTKYRLDRQSCKGRKPHGAVKGTEEIKGFEYHNRGRISKKEAGVIG